MEVVGMEVEGHPLVHACPLGHMMTAAMTVGIEDITLATAPVVVAAGDMFKLMYLTGTHSVEWNL